MILLCLVGILARRPEAEILLEDPIQTIRWHALVQDEGDEDFLTRKTTVLAGLDIAGKAYL